MLFLNYHCSGDFLINIFNIALLKWDSAESDGHGQQPQHATNIFDISLIINILGKMK